jgi:hypothetical protein
MITRLIMILFILMLTNRISHLADTCCSTLDYYRLQIKVEISHQGDPIVDKSYLFWSALSAGLLTTVAQIPAALAQPTTATPTAVPIDSTPMKARSAPISDPIKASGPTTVSPSFRVDTPPQPSGSTAVAPSSNPASITVSTPLQPSGTAPIAPDKGTSTYSVPFKDPAQPSVTQKIAVPNPAQPSTTAPIAPTANNPSPPTSPATNPVAASPQILIPSGLFSDPDRDRRLMVTSQAEPSSFQSGATPIIPPPQAKSVNQSAATTPPTAAELQLLQERLKKSQAEYEQATIKLDRLRVEMQQLLETMKKSPTSFLPSPAIGF